MQESPPTPETPPREAGGDPWFPCFVVLAVLAALVLAAAVWSIPRGVSFVDEGYFLEDALHPGVSFTLWGSIVHGLFSWTGLGLVALRWVNVAGLGAVSAWFAVRAGRWMEAEGLLEGQGAWARHAAAALVFSGSLLRLATVPLAASYNTVNEALVLTALVLLLDARTHRLQGRSATWRRAAAVGAVVATDLFVKAPSAVALAVVVLAAWPLCVAGDWRKLVAHAASACAGGAVACGAAFVLLVTPQEWFDVVVRVAPLFGRVDPEHAQARVAARFPGEVVEGAVIAAVHYRWFLVPAVAGLAALAFLRRRGRAVSPRLVAAATLLAAALFVARIVHTGQHLAPLRGVVQPYVAFLLVAVTAVAVTSTRAGLARRRGAGGVAVALLAAAFAGVYGSNRHWMMYWPLYATPWFAVCAVAATALGRALAVRWAGPLAAGLLGALAASQTVAGMVATPMGLAPRWRQTEALVGFPAFEGVLVDPATLAYLTRLRDLAGPAPASDGEPGCLGFFCVEAEQVALGRRVLGGVSSLLYLSEPERVAETLEDLPRDRLRGALVLVHARGAADGPGRVLRAMGLPFPEGWVLRGSVENPWTHRPVGVWVPRR